MKYSKSHKKFLMLIKKRKLYNRFFKLENYFHFLKNGFTYNEVYKIINGNFDDLMFDTNDLKKFGINIKNKEKVTFKEIYDYNRN